MFGHFVLHAPPHSSVDCGGLGSPPESPRVTYSSTNDCPATNINFETAIGAILSEEREICIEVRDTGIAIAKIAKDTLASGGSVESVVSTIREKVDHLYRMTAAMEGLTHRKGVLTQLYPATPAVLIQRSAVLGRPRRFRRQKKRALSTETELENPPGDVVCEQCGSCQIVEWGWGTTGPRPLCNSCSVQHASSASSPLSSPQTHPSNAVALVPKKQRMIPVPALNLQRLTTMSLSSPMSSPVSFDLLSVPHMPLGAQISPREAVPLMPRLCITSGPSASTPRAFGLANGDTGRSPRSPRDEPMLANQVMHINNLVN